MYSRCRAFLRDNQSLETLILKWIKFKGSSNGPPVVLPNVKSLGVHFPQGTLSAVFRVLALQRLSSLSFAADLDGSADYFTLCATGEEIMLTIKCALRNITGTWRGTLSQASNIFTSRIRGLFQFVMVW